MLLTRPANYRIIDRDIIVGESNQDYVLRVRDLADADKPREKLVSLGPQRLSVAELVAILWSVGSKKEDVLAMAHRIIQIIILGMLRILQEITQIRVNIR